MDDDKKTQLTGLAAAGAALFLIFAVASTGSGKCDAEDIKCQKAAEFINSPSRG